MPEYDRHGKMISLLVVGVDQTERREAKEQIRNSAARSILQLECISHQCCPVK